MAEISHGGLWIRWSSLKPRDKRGFGVSMVLFLASGIQMGALSGWFEKEPLVATPANMLLAMSPMLPLVLGTILYVRFVLRQDELFRRFHLITTVCGGVAMVLLLLPLLMMEQVLGAAPLGLEALLLAFAVGSVIGGFWATRRYL